MALEGDVGTFPLDDLFAWLARRRASGVLTLTRGMSIRRFHLRAGQVRLVSSSEQEMLLGQLLIERQLLGPQALAKALAARGRSRARLGRLLMRGGLVTRRELRAILAEKVRRLLADALTWRDGRFLYEAPRPGGAAEEGRPAVRRGEIAVAVDLAGALAGALAQTRPVPPPPPRPAGGADACLAVDDSDVIEAVPAGDDDGPAG